MRLPFAEGCHLWSTCCVPGVLLSRGFFGAPSRRLGPHCCGVHLIHKCYPVPDPHPVGSTGCVAWCAALIGQSKQKQLSSRGTAGTGARGGLQGATWGVRPGLGDPLGPSPSGVPQIHPVSSLHPKAPGARSPYPQSAEAAEAQTKGTILGKVATARISRLQGCSLWLRARGLGLARKYLGTGGKGVQGQLGLSRRRKKAWKRRGKVTQTKTHTQKQSGRNRDGDWERNNERQGK